MQITIKLTEKELTFLQHEIDEDKILEGNDKSLEDAIHECIERAMFDESEESAQEEGM